MMAGLVEINLEITFFATFRAGMIVHASNAIANFLAEANRIRDGLATVRASVTHFHLSSVCHPIFTVTIRDKVNSLKFIMKSGKFEIDDYFTY